MTITREQVADLRPGDVVEVHRQGWAEGTVLRGPITIEPCFGDVSVGDWLVLRRESGDGPSWPSFPGSTLTVISRAPRPLYVNHDRTEPVVGDVVRCDEAGGSLTLCWIYDGDRREYGWQETSSDMWVGPKKPWRRLRLLVDGATGQVVR